MRILFEKGNMRTALIIFLFTHLILLSWAVASPAQTGEATDAEAKSQVPPIVDPSPSPSPSPTPRREGNFVKNSLRDQKLILTSPFRVNRNDLKWVVPFAAATTVLLLTDSKTSSWIGHTGKLTTASHGISYAGSLFSTAGFAGGLYLIGGATHSPRIKKTGKLAFEALLGTGVVVGVLKHTTGRMRPNLDSGSGNFFEDGGRSFPSGHSSNVWSVATVIASEYKDRPLVRYAAIVIAIAVSLSRYTGRTHFMSEVLLGSAIGIGIGRFVYVTHR